MMLTKTLIIVPIVETNTTEQALSNAINQVMFPNIIVVVVALTSYMNLEHHPELKVIRMIIGTNNRLC